MVESHSAIANIDEAVEVLYLEDDRDLAALYEDKLRMDGYHVRTVPLDASPPAVMAGAAPELLFVDIRSRARVAVEALAAWRRDARVGNAPAVILSDANSATLEERGIHLGPLDQLLRPAALRLQQ